MRIFSVQELLFFSGESCKEGGGAIRGGPAANRPGLQSAEEKPDKSANNQKSEHREQQSFSRVFVLVFQNNSDVITPRRAERHTECKYGKWGNGWRVPKFRPLAKCNRRKSARGS